MIPGIADRPEKAVLVRRPHGELIHVGLTHTDHPGGCHVANNRRIIGCDEVAQHLRSRCGQYALGAKNIFVSKRQAQSRAFTASSTLIVSLGRSRQSGIGVDCNKTIQGRIGLLNAIQVRLSELDT